MYTKAVVYNFLSKMTVGRKTPSSEQKFHARSPHFAAMRHQLIGTVDLPVRVTADEEACRRPASAVPNENV